MQRTQQARTPARASLPGRRRAARSVACAGALLALLAPASALAAATTTANPPTGAGQLPASARSPTVTLSTTTLRSEAKQGSGGISDTAIIIAVAAALVALACGIWALAQARAYEPRWSVALRHSLSEAGFRASATWSEFTDWIRLGH